MILLGGEKKIFLTFSSFNMEKHSTKQEKSGKRAELDAFPCYERIIGMVQTCPIGSAFSTQNNLGIINLSRIGPKPTLLAEGRWI